VNCGDASDFVPGDHMSSHPPNNFSTLRRLQLFVDTSCCAPVTS
jgi:hypothetical protein